MSAAAQFQATTSTKAESPPPPHQPTGRPQPLLRAMSLENIAGPGTYSLFHQKEYLLTFPTPTRY